MAKICWNLLLKKELLKLPVFGIYASRVGIPIDRAGGAKTMRLMLAAAKKATAGGQQIVIFPEGSRAPPGAPLRNAETGAMIANSPFMNSLIVTIALIFMVCGIAYGKGARTKGQTDCRQGLARPAGCL